METGDIFAKDNWTKPAFSMIWLMKELMIYNDLKKQFLIKSFHDKAFDIVKNTKNYGYQRGCLQWLSSRLSTWISSAVYNIFENMLLLKKDLTLM